MSTPFKMKSSPAKMWPWGKTKKSKSVKDGYETKTKTTTRGNVVKTKTSKRLLAGEQSKDGVVDVITSSKTKDGKVVKSKNVVIDNDGYRKTKTTTNPRRTKTTTRGYNKAGSNVGDSGASHVKSRKITWH